MQTNSQKVAGIRGSAGALMSLLFPNRCSFCGETLNCGACICDNCLSRLEIIHNTMCLRCGAPAMRAPQRCEQCADLQFRFGRNVSLGAYEGMLRRLVHLFKFEGRWALYMLFGQLLVEHRQVYIVRYDLLVPVPLTPARFSERGFNQSVLTARSVAGIMHVPPVRRALERRGNAPPQSSIQSAGQRVKNVTDRFTVRDRFEPLVRKKRVLLVDDVLTTGATASAAAEALYRSGASAVDVLTVARALKAPGALYHS